MSTIFAALELLAALSAIAVLIRNHRRARASFPSVSDDTVAVSGWSWSEPPTGLDIRHDPASSAVALPLRQTHGVSAGVVLLGYATLGFSLFMLVQGLLVHDNIWIPIIASPIFGLFGWGMLHADARLTHVVLSEERATLVVRYGIGLHRQIVLSRARPRRVSGTYISTLEMSRNQQHPEYRIRIGRHKMLSDCDQTQGSWLVAGLKQWWQSA